MRGRLLEFCFGAILDPFISRCFYDEEIASFPIGPIIGFSWIKMPCQSCSFNYYSCIVQVFENDEKSMGFLCSHGVLPTTVTWLHCRTLCAYRKDQKIWRCRKRISVPKSKKTTCSFTISDFKGSFLHTYLPNPSARAGYDTRSIFKRSLTGLNSEFSFS